MESSTHRTTRVFLSFALVFSLAGISGFESVANAFAAEDPEIIQEDIALQQVGEEDAFFFDDLSKDQQLEGEDELEGTVAPVLIAEDSEESALESDASGFSLKTPDKRYVYEYVYGIFSNEYTVVSNDENDDYGVLISSNQGEVFGTDIELNKWYGSAIAEGAYSYVPFRQNGKFGLLDLKRRAISIDAVFDRAYNGTSDGSIWGFISLGDINAQGIFPNAKAVIFENGNRACEVGLSSFDARSEGYIYLYDDKWSVSWTELSEGGVQKYRTLTYSYGDSGYQIIEEYYSGSISYKTFDGRFVRFREKDGKVAFSVSDDSGHVSPELFLETNNTNISSFRTVSNIIEVSKSNGYNYQYFTLDGKLLQSLNDQHLTGFANYASYGRVDFGTQKLVQVFLDTSDDCKEAKSIPAIETSFPVSTSSSKFEMDSPYFECLTEGNEIQRYDKNLNMVYQIDASLDLPSSLQEGRYVAWSLVDCGDNTWSVRETIKYSASSSDYIGYKSYIERNGAILDPSLFGFNSEDIPKIYYSDKLLYCLDDGASPQLRLFEYGLKPLKEISISRYSTPSNVITGVSLTSILDISGTRVSITLRDLEGKYSYQYFYLNEKLEAFEYSDVQRRVFDDMHAAQKDGKWGFVDSQFRPISEFVYDSIPRTVSINGKTYFAPMIDGKSRLLDMRANDLLGYSCDWFLGIGAGFICVEVNGNLVVLDENFNQVNTYGYVPIKHEADTVTSSGAYRYTSRARILDDGTLMLYVQNAQGKIGAIDRDGNVIIPFEYDDYAEELATDNPTSDYIMLKDADGWFFMPVADLVGNAPSDECDSLGHEYEAFLYEPTCTTNGYTQYVCKRCGNAYRDEASTVPALGHDFIITELATEPTCTEDGKGAVYTCTRCGQTKQDPNIPNFGWHSDYAWVTTLSPTCTSEGLRERTCSRCGNHEEEAIAAYGHSWSHPTWEWSDDYNSASANMYCTRGCGESNSIDGEVTHMAVDDGVRHSAEFEMNGRKYQDGRLVLGWADSNGIARNMIVKGEPVAAGFYVWPHGLELPDDADTTVEISITPVNEGGIFDALVAKIGSGWPAGTFDVSLLINGEETHEGFGVLKFSFPAGSESAGKKATIYHCHKNDRDNITSHDVYVSDDGEIILSDIVDLSTFALSIQDDDADVVIEPASTATPSSKVVGSSLAQTSDNAGKAMVSLAVISVLSALIVAAALTLYVRRRANKRE